MQTSHLRGFPHRRRGAALVYVTIAMTVFVGFISLGIDVAHVRLVKVELQGAADAAARFGAVGLNTDTTTATNDAIAAAAGNIADGSAVALNSATDIDFGTWDPSTKTFTLLTGAAASGANAIRVRASRKAANGNAVSCFFGSLIGFGSADVTATATAAIDATTQYGIVGLNGVNLSGNSVTAYNSATGVSNSSGTVVSNKTIAMSGGAIIHGDAHAGSGYSVTMSGGSSVTGSTSSMTSTLSYPNVSAGTAATTNNDASAGSCWNSGNNDFTLSSGTFTLPGGTYYFHDFKVQGGATTNLVFSGAATVYVTGAVTISGGITTYNSRAANLGIDVIGSGNVNVSGGGSTYAMINAPQSTVTVSGSGIFYGSMIASTVTGSGSARMCCDTSLENPSAVYLAQ